MVCVWCGEGVEGLLLDNTKIIVVLCVVGSNLMLQVKMSKGNVQLQQEKKKSPRRFQRSIDIVWKDLCENVSI